MVGKLKKEQELHVGKWMEEQLVQKNEPASN